MYHQLLVPEDQQSFLKFLWWENHDIDTEHHDYVMCARAFGATSSANFSNYALRRTAMKNEAVFGEAAANALIIVHRQAPEFYRRLRFSQRTCDRCHQYVQVWWLPSYQIYLQ